ncbi:MAG: bifunctional demethylmenaquinone methyltransferase/2-methoxy-6-polyprenyl-1,4-benzoquinol methylase UbiE [Paludibacteraceae bacterium]|nr:bifunctional demethylmenaquinone methyltransferase/2-methoxy-6-polyprenyl-1,4-benzoquinol methylase UbiE [Paludibacteraceae bacterium]
MAELLTEKKNIGSLFNRIAGHYDTLNHLLSAGIDRRWRRKAVKGMPAGGEWLDVAVGTADLTLEILRQDKARRITAVDLSEGMMQIGREKVAKAGLADRVDFLPADCQHLPFAERRFHSITCAFGVRNFQHLDEGLREMYRVMEPGGELMILELSYPGNRLVRTVYDFYFTRILPWIGGLLSHDKKAYRYLNNSVKHFLWGRALCDRIAAAGFTGVAFTPLTLGICTVYRARKEG